MMEHGIFGFFTAMFFVIFIILSPPSSSFDIIDIGGQNLSHTAEASLIANYFLTHEDEAHYVYESIRASEDLAKNISSGNPVVTQELLNAFSWYALTSLPDFLRDEIVRGIAGVIVDETGVAMVRANVNLNSSKPLSDEDIQKIRSEFNYVKTVTRSITIAKPLIQNYRQENDSTIFIILLNKAIEMSAYVASTPTFQTVMDIVVDELSQGFLKSGLPERIVTEGDAFLNDQNNTLSIVKLVIESSNIERLISRSYNASKHVLDDLYNGDTLFLFATVINGFRGQQNPLIQSAFKFIEADFIINYMKEIGGNISSIYSDSSNTYVDVIGDVDFLAMIQSMLASTEAREFLPYNSSSEEDAIDGDCYQDVLDMLDAAKAGRIWALRMIDSIGKIPHGVLRGNLNFLGDMDMCVNVRSDINGYEVLGNVTRSSPRDPRFVRSKYCRAVLSSEDMDLDVAKVGVKPRITWGVCVPKTCKEDDVYGLLKLDVFQNTTANLQKVECLQETNITQDTAAIITISILCFFGFLVLCATAYVAMETREIVGGKTVTDGYVSGETTHQKGNVEEQRNDLKDVHIDEQNNKHTNINVVLNKYVLQSESDDQAANIASQNNDIHSNGASNDAGVTKQTVPTHKPVTIDTSIDREESLGIKIIKAFSLQANIPRILKAEASPGSIHCLHGIRFLSISWVILAHSVSLGFFKDSDQVWPLVNPDDVMTMMQRFTAQILISAGTPVDTFLMMSGTLLTYTQLEHIEKIKMSGSKVVRYVSFYFVTRIFRLMPVYILVLLVYTTLFTHMVYGPLMPVNLEYVTHCNDNWWTNLLFINNLVKTNEQCMEWSFYLSLDMQFYIVSLVLLFLMVLKLGMGIATTVTLVVGSMIITAWQQYQYTGDLLMWLQDDNGYLKNVYIAPWCRIGAFLVGLIFGVYLKKRPRKPLSKVIGFAGWTIATLVALTLKYCKYSVYMEGGDPWTRLQNAIYESFDRPVWAMCVAWVVFACHNKMGGIVNSLLSWGGFIPLSRLGYCIYLVHPIVILVHGFSRRSLFYVDDFGLVYLIVGHTTISLMCAFVLATAIEFPFMGIMKSMTGRM
ncbi:O-acyltransferase like protein-like [Argopecten irradians]|uniref:O-acyltransferase like protein-like n=1 Tax=Argopecten irradians TaxID=31199 RepID=UPI0037193D82